MNADDRFTTHDAMRRTGAKLDQIAHLIRTDTIVPVKPASRRGVSPQLDRINVAQIAVAVRMLQWRVGVEQIADMFDKAEIKSAWDKLFDPTQAASVETLVVFRMVERTETGLNTVEYLAHMVPAKMMASAVVAGSDGFFVNMKALVKQIATDPADDDTGKNDQPINRKDIDY